ncbi:hypothetical protein HDU87_002237 [Geranomyces variabilis]|uniref:SH3 domain-containing protein n=1 Tax=Geranomyces variabilis TaxID=109894 RepID=A0AAD5XS43_9FUNG|nr:hypothetical protein HDU87_002237 [Geranomyces variabilis]
MTLATALAELRQMEVVVSPAQKEELLKDLQLERENQRRQYEEKLRKAEERLMLRSREFWTSLPAELRGMTVRDFFTVEKKKRLGGEREGSYYAKPTASAGQNKDEAGDSLSWLDCSDVDEPESHEVRSLYTMIASCAPAGPVEVLTCFFVRRRRRWAFLLASPTAAATTTADAGPRKANLPSATELASDRQETSDPDLLPCSSSMSATTAAPGAYPALAGDPLKYPLVITQPDPKSNLTVVANSSPQITVTVQCITKYGACPTGTYLLYFTENNKVIGSYQNWPITAFPATAPFVNQFLMGGSDAILLRFPGASVFTNPSAADGIQGGQFKSTTPFTVDQPLLPLLWGVLDQTQPALATLPATVPATVPAAAAPAAANSATPVAAADPANSAAAPAANSGSSSPSSTQGVSASATSNADSIASSDGNSTQDLIIGFAVIGLIVVLVGIIVALLCRRRRKRRNGMAINNTVLGQPYMSSSVPSGFVGQSSVPSGFVGQPSGSVGQPMQNSNIAFAPYHPQVPPKETSPAPQRVPNSLFDRSLAEAREPAPVVMPAPPPRGTEEPSGSYAYYGSSQQSPSSPSVATRGNTLMSNSTADSSYDSSAPGRQNTIQSNSTSDTFSARPTVFGGPAANHSPFSYAGPHEPKLQDALRRDGFLHDASSTVPSVSDSSVSGAGKSKAPRAIPTHEVDSGVSQGDVDALENGAHDVDVLPPMYDSLVPAGSAPASTPARDVKSAFRHSTAAGGAEGIHPGAVVRATHAYARQHPDELDLEVGKALVVTQLLQDARARGFVLGTSVSGVFPLRCVTLVPDAHTQNFF